LKKQLDTVNHLPKEYVFLNYLRCHDDIGWGLDYATLAQEGIGEVTHKAYLNDYFLGVAGYSNSRGELYNYDPVTQDARFCGTTASLCGVEKALAEGNPDAVKKAVDLVVMLHAYMFMQSGIPILYSGDEIGQLNDYSYKNDAHKAGDSRFIHRGAMRWEDAAKANDMESVQGQIYQRLAQLEQLRKTHPAFVTNADAWTLESYEQSILVMGRYYEGEKMLGLFNFSENDKVAWINEQDGMYVDIVSGMRMAARSVKMHGYGFYWLRLQTDK
jgi:amylosucrase